MELIQGGVQPLQTAGDGGGNERPHKNKGANASRDLNSGEAKAEWSATGFGNR